MSHKLFALVAGLLIALHSAGAARAQDDQEAFLIANQALPALSMGDVDKLEKMGSDYLATKERLADGTWKLDAFHGGIQTFMMGGAQFDLLMSVVEKWEKVHPNSRIAPVVHAHILVSHAFDIRGSKVSSEVWDEDWKPFQDGLKKALVILEDRKEQASANPRWYATIVQIKGALGFPKSAILAEAREGMAKEPTYGPTPRAALNYLMPKWGGSAKAVRDWIDEAAKLTRPTEGDALYARLAWDIIENRYDFSQLRHLIDWNRLKKASDDRIGRYPVTANKVKALDVACQYRDAEEVVRRYTVIAKEAGPKMAQTVDPALHCNWSKTTRPVPGVTDPDTLPGADTPKKTRAN